MFNRFEGSYLKIRYQPNSKAKKLEHKKLQYPTNWIAYLENTHQHNPKNTKVIEIHVHMKDIGFFLSIKVQNV